MAPRARSLIAVAALLLSAVVVAGVTESPASATTFSVTSTEMCGGAGTFQQALADANANPGLDTIEFAPGITVEAWTCNMLPSPIFSYPLSATDSVTIVGNGSTVLGGQVFVNSSGRVNDPNECPSRTAGTLMVTPSVGFLEVGTYDIDNTAVSVAVSNLKFSGMPSLFLVERNASLAVTDTSADKTYSFNDDCSRPPIQSSGGNVTLTRVTITGSSTPASQVNEPTSLTAVVAGFGSGELVMDHVTMGNNFSGRAIAWGGSSAKIVNSQFLESGGFELNAANSDIVNSGWWSHRQEAVDRIISLAGVVRIEASSFFWSWPVCSECSVASLGFATGGSGRFDFHSSAIGSGADIPVAAPLLWGDVSAFSSDAFTWVQPTGAQDAAAINAILPSALTGPPGLTTSFIGGLTGSASADLTPLLGTSGTPGVLIDAIPSATCTSPDDANALRSPIDGSCIVLDVLGNPRWDAGNGKRNIGAIQTVSSPHLTVVGTGRDIVLGWNQPPDPLSGAITGYQVSYVPVAGGATQTIEVTGPSLTTATVTGLVPGVEYRFTVAAVNGVGPGPSSNTVSATPMGSVGVPAVTAAGGAGAVHLFWTEPDAGGHPGPLSYFVTYRPLGSLGWNIGPGPILGRIATISGLDDGTTYEFGVVAVANDGAMSGEIGIAMASTDPLPSPDVRPVFTG